MTNRIVTFSPEARNKLVEGVNILANAVGITLGPRGRNVVIDTYGEPAVTKDGVTVAREIRLDDAIQSLGANIVKQAASRTAVTAGDGTTTATVLAQALINNGVSLIENNGISPIDIKRKYEDFLSASLETILGQSRPVTLENVKQIATISANNDPTIGDLIYQGFEFVGMDGMVSVEDSKTSSTYVETVEGTQIKSGWISPYFVTDSQRMEAVYSNPLILITDKKVVSTQQLVPALEIAAKASRPLLIIADELQAQALTLLVVNRLKHALPVVAISAPAFGERRSEIMKDLAVLTGAELITEAKAQTLEAVTINQLGSADKIVVTKDSTLIISPKGDAASIAARIAEVKTQLSQPDISEQAEWIVSKLNERLSNLTGKVAVFYVGAATQTELKEKKDRIDDALRATKSAITLGYVPGGGLALFTAAQEIGTGGYKDEKVPLDPIREAFFKALNSPYKLIQQNANIEPKPPLNDHTALNCLTGEMVNFEKAGIIDPTLVVVEALTNATSAANMVLLSEVTVHDIEPKYQPAAINPY